MELRAEKRYDKNNRLVTRHVKANQPQKQNAFLSILKPLVNKEAREDKKRRDQLLETFTQQALAEYAREREDAIEHDKKRSNGDKGYDEGLDNATERINKRLKQLSLNTLELMKQYPPSQGINEFTRVYFEETPESRIRERLMYPDFRFAPQASEYLHEITQTDDLTEFGEDTEEHHRIKAVYEVAGTFNLPDDSDRESAFIQLIWDHHARHEEIIDFGMKNWGPRGFSEGDLDRLETYLNHPVQALAEGAL